MQMNYNESQTRKNLMRAFAGECQSRQRYYQAALIAQQQKLIGLERMFINDKLSFKPQIHTTAARKKRQNFYRIIFNVVI